MITIDGTNYDAYVVNKKYNVQQTDELGGTEYLDGWWKAHRMVVRTRVAGKVVLAMNPSAYSAFIAALDSHAGTEGEHTITLFVQNLGVEKTITAFIYTTAKVAMATQAFGGGAVFFNITLVIEER